MSRAGSPGESGPILLESGSMVDHHLTVHGARGSAPTAGGHVARYGGHTTCFEVDTGSDDAVIVDAGTAIAFARGLTEHARYHLFFTHFHLDHVQGLPFFRPVYDPEVEFVFYGSPPAGMSLSDAIEGVFRPPWFPVTFSETLSKKQFVELNGTSHQIDDLTVQSARLHHPQGCRAYRFDRDGRSAVIATDHEAGENSVDDGLSELCEGADVLFHDGQYTHEEYATRVGWGHSTWEGAARAADRAGVESLVLTSHDPAHSDAEVDDMVRRAGDYFDDVTAARPGLRVRV
jgi:phosphoribosyl 1,2-cyclic phosphodiesterase